MSRPAVEVHDGALLLRTPKAVWVVTAAEVLGLLRGDAETARRALLRGKRWRRAEATAKREATSALP
jgi:hypothetical protein